MYNRKQSITSMILETKPTKSMNPLRSAVFFQILKEQALAGFISFSKKENVLGIKVFKYGVNLVTSSDQRIESVRIKQTSCDVIII